MAIYRFEAKPIKRSAGRSALAAAAYRAGERLTDERTGQSFDYGRRSGVVHAEVLTPEGAPGWAHDRQSLWQAVERAEKRKDAQLAREIVLALPHELAKAERIELLQEFARAQFVSRGMVADISVHAPDREADPRNHHAHILLTMRALNADGFGPKVRDWNDKALLQSWREEWADSVNRALQRAGYEARVDHRTLEAQGIGREPEPKMGPIATEIERDGRVSLAGEERRAVKTRNAERGELIAEARVINIELERQKRAAALFDRADYVSTTRDAQNLVAKHHRERAARHHHDGHDHAEDHRERRRRDDDDRRRQVGGDVDRSSSNESRTSAVMPKGEMTDGKRTAFERLLRNLERESPLGESKRPQEAGRGDSGGRQRGR